MDCHRKRYQRFYFIFSFVVAALQKTVQIATSGENEMGREEKSHWILKHQKKNTIKMSISEHFLPLYSHLSEA